MKLRTVPALHCALVGRLGKAFDAWRNIEPCAQLLAVLFVELVGHCTSMEGRKGGNTLRNEGREKERGKTGLFNQAREEIALAQREEGEERSRGLRGAIQRDHDLEQERAAAWAATASTAQGETAYRKINGVRPMMCVGGESSVVG